MNSDGNFQQMGQQLKTLFRQAVPLANLEVDAIIQSGEQGTQRIEHQLDHMLGFCCDPDMLLGFKRVCRYYYGMNPVATAGYVNAYREMWDRPDEAAAGGAELDQLIRQKLGGLGCEFRAHADSLFREQNAS
jgi:hypothetical protein